jgi:hypothetical protein
MTVSGSTVFNVQVPGSWFRVQKFKIQDSRFKIEIVDPGVSLLHCLNLVVLSEINIPQFGGIDILDFKQVQHARVR